MNSAIDRDRQDLAAGGDHVPTEADIQATADFILKAGADTGEDEVQETADFILHAGQGKA